MPVPKPLMSDSEIQARMGSALMAWRRIAAAMAARNAPKGTVPMAALAIQSNHDIDSDLEKIAEAFDAWPAAWAHIEDLRDEIARLEREPAPLPPAHMHGVADENWKTRP